MKEFWRFAVCCFYLLSLSFCCSINDEGVALLRFKEKIESDPNEALSNWIDDVGVESPCSWFGVECSQGYVVVLNLKDLCLEGTLPPDIGNLVHIKSIILRNNSFYGIVPEEIANLKELKVLDIGYNNFSAHIPCRLGNGFSIAILLIDNNELLESIHYRIYELQKLSEEQVKKGLLPTPNQGPFCNGLLISWNSKETRNMAQRKLLQQAPPVRRPGWRFLPPPVPRTRNLPPPPSTSTPAPAPAPPRAPEPLEPPPSPPITRVVPLERPNAPIGRSGTNRNRAIILSAAIGGPLLVVLLAISILLYKFCKVATVTPSGLSGQLQRAFITGVPKLKRAELEAACESFSNVIGSSSVGTLYKGTLSSGVEIAVESINVSSTNEWSKDLECRFRKKIDTISKVNHKNFVSLLGYCEEKEPFTRILVFEYAPNGTLFEHLHIREAEHLDWSTRLRIAMGTAYCLNHMHQLSPPLPHKNLTSSSIYLTEDYAAKVSDFVLPHEATPERQPNPKSNVYDFGVVLFEMITGKLPYSVGGDDVSGDDWASDYLRGAETLRDVVDPTLRTYCEDQVEMIGGVIRLCARKDETQRPCMGEVCTMLREITGVGPDQAIPKLSPLWWAELEIMSNEGG